MYTISLKIYFQIYFQQLQEHQGLDLVSKSDFNPI